MATSTGIRDTVERTRKYIVVVNASESRMTLIHWSFSPTFFFLSWDTMETMSIEWTVLMTGVSESEVWKCEINR